MEPVIPELLRTILATKRPTNNPSFNYNFTCKLLRDLLIYHHCDEHYNISVIIGDKPNTMFTAHTDTVDRTLGENNLEIENSYIFANPPSVLGADCGAGMYILIQMILANKPGLYVFFSQEEQGGIGSQQYQLPYKGITKCISFDRKGTDSLITHQMGEQGCSKEFAEYFTQNFPLPFKEDPTGVFTDSYTFFDSIPECVNLSVGYYQEHTKYEYLDLDFVLAMSQACIEFDWGKLPVGERTDEIPIYPNIDLEDFCWRHPDIVAAVLIDYGITIKDLEDYYYE